MIFYGISCLTPVSRFKRMSEPLCVDSGKRSSKDEEKVLGLDADFEDRAFQVVLYDSDKVVASIALTKKQMHHSRLLSTSIEGDSNAVEIPLKIDKAACINIYTFTKAMSYLKKHGDSKIVVPERPLGSLKLQEIWRDPWDVSFIDEVYSDSTGCDRLYELMNASNYLDINPLIHLVGSKIAQIINKTEPSKLHQELGLTCQASSSSKK